MQQSPQVLCNDDHKEFKPCLNACFVTCETRLRPQCPNAGRCNPGCQCKVRFPRLQPSENTAGFSFHISSNPAMIRILVVCFPRNVPPPPPPRVGSHFPLRGKLFIGLRRIPSAPMTASINSPTEPWVSEWTVLGRCTATIRLKIS